MNETEALSYLAEIIDAARAGGAPREHIQALQMAREAIAQDTSTRAGGGQQCQDCPVYSCDAYYRGSRCAALRAAAGVDYDPMIRRGRIVNETDTV